MTPPLTIRRPFTVLIPSLDDSPPTEVHINIPVVWDNEVKEEMMTAEAHQLIDFIKMRGMLSVLYAEVGALKARVATLEDSKPTGPM